MEKDRFLLLAQNFTSLSPEEAKELVALQNAFPYSQLIHNLAARASQDHHLDSRELNLHLSAVYATDRTVLKAVMTSPGKPRMELHKAVSAGPTLKKAEPPPTFNPVKEPTQTTELLWEELALDLDKLKELKQNFETLFDSPVGNVARITKKKVESPKVEENVQPLDLIDEIKSSKKKIKPERPKQKEQLEIINEFIKTKPSISKGKLAAPSGPVPTDLSESSIVFTENIISETLVDLLLRQGKRDKAIDVLKKLIWKFPQKKAYFAAQIEELKK